jgi:glycosyltransferase involved in cell wall biosynthesis
LPVQTSYIPPLVVSSPPEERPAGRGLYYLFVGRLIRAKGLQTILPLFRRTGRKLLVAGSGAYEAELRRLAAEATNIQFLGHITSEQLPALYAGAVATLVPSLCYEVGPRVAIESLQQGTPVIVPDLGGMPEIIADTGGGWVYGSLDMLAEILDRIEARPEEARQLGQRARQSAWRYSPEHHLREYLAVIEQVRASRSPAAPTPS